MNEKYCDVIPRRREWLAAGTSAALLLFVYVIIYRDGIKSAVNLWVNTGAYNHCFLIIPISIYLIWSNKASLKDVKPEPTLAGGAVSLIFSGLWWLSYISGIAEGVHFAIIGVLQGILLSVFGWRIYRALLLPFLYLWLMVPTGEFLLPPLQELTARSAAVLLDWVNIPVFRDGVMIEVPTGSYMVAPGCAGLNFLLASLALSIAYAELTYRDGMRRILFVFAMLLMAVVGNTIRVFLIIAVAHWTNNIGDIVDDHVLYGWGFFSLLTLSMMAVGHRFQQPDLPVAIPPAAGRKGGPLWLVSAASAILVGAVPLGAHAAASVAQDMGPVAPPTLTCGNWAPLASDMGWLHDRGRVDALAETECAQSSRRIRFAIALLRRPVRQGKLLGLDQWLIGGEPWTPVERKIVHASVDGRSVSIRAVTLERGGARRLVWSLAWAADAWRAPGWDTAVGDLLGELVSRRRAALVLVAADGDDAEAEAALRDFVSQTPLRRLVGGNADMGENG